MSNRDPSSYSFITYKRDEKQWREIQRLWVAKDGTATCVAEDSREIGWDSYVTTIPCNGWFHGITKMGKDIRDAWIYAAPLGVFDEDEFFRMAKENA